MRSRRRQMIYILGCGIGIALVLSLIIFDRYDIHTVSSMRVRLADIVYTTEGRKQSLTKKTKVLLISHFRSGSSLTGGILENAKDAFYVFEPLRMFHNSLREIQGSVWADEHLRKASLKMIRAWLTCDIYQIPRPFIQTEVFLDFGRKTSQFFRCMAQKVEVSANVADKATECIEMLVSLCRESPTQIIKTIRMPLSQVRSLMSEFPDLFVINLVRDPRGILNSARLFGDCQNGGPRACANRLCRKMRQDIQSESELRADFPDRIRHVLYSDVALHPVSTTRSLFDFLGQELTEDTLAYIRNKTTIDIGEWKPHLHNRNASKVVGSWKNDLPRHYVRNIERQCSSVLKHYGMLKDSSSH